MVSLKHKFSSAKADGTDATLLKPSNWNDEHNLTLAAASRLLGRDASAAGAVQELAVVTNGGGDAFQFWTAAKVAAAISAAIAAIPVVTWVPTGATLGWYSNSLPSGGWTFCNGRTMGATASAASLQGVAYQNLYNFLWASLTDAVNPMQTNNGSPATRGSTPLNDWNAGKRIVLPDECGRVTAGMNNMGGVTSKNRLTTSSSGLNGDVLGAAGGIQSLNHSHTGMTGVNAPPGAFGAVGNGPTTGDHGHPFQTDASAVAVVQPTIIKNVIIKL